MIDERLVKIKKKYNKENGKWILTEKIGKNVLKKFLWEGLAIIRKYMGDEFCNKIKKPTFLL